MKIIIAMVVVAVFITAGIIFLDLNFIRRNAIYEKDHPCLESHKEQRYRRPWTQMLSTGKAIIPIFHPGYHYEADVCDLRK